MAKTGFNLSPAKIKVIGLGGGGCNAVSRMIRHELRGIEFIAMNTDAQALALSEAPTRIQLGMVLTRGFGVGGDPKLGEKAAEENLDEIKKAVAEADMVFITCGMGGGTGTGTAPVVANLARLSGALTIAVVTKPFSFEGTHRREVAEEGIASLLGKVDTLIIIPNDRLLALCESTTGVDNAFTLADDVLRHGIQAISEVITVPGLINLDFADVRTVMKDAGPAWMSVGMGTGQNRAIEAAKEALASPLLDVSIEGATGVLFNVVGGSNLTLFEVNEAAKIIKEAVDPEANIIFGVVHDPNMDREVKIILIATGFVAKEELSLTTQSEELSRFLDDLKKSEDALDAPSFLRGQRFGRRHKVRLPSVELDKTASEVVTS